MSSACLSSAQMQAFLAGTLRADQEDEVVLHLECCERCERLAGRLSDDAQARELASTKGSARGGHAGGTELHDLCKRLHALGMFGSALDEVEKPPAEAPADTAIHCAKISDTAKFKPVALSLAAEQIDGTPLFTHLGRYRIERALGAGAFGIVYLAEDSRLHRKVAIKVARATVLTEPGLRIRFFREAEAVARLEHPHIVPVYEADEIDGLCFLTLAYAEGPTLDQWLQEQGGRLEPRLAAQLMLPLVEAVEHAHTRGILHRDIKPGNVLLRKAAEGELLPVIPKLTDFGLAKVVEERSDSTLSGIVLGTANYMAPEQAAGHLERIGPATDVYALGSMLYQLLTGRVPIEGKTTIDTLRRLLIDEPAEVCSLAADVPEDLGAIAHQCLQKSPAQRYQSAAELAADLRQFLAGRATKARPLSPLERTTRWLGRHRSWAAFLTLAGVAVGLSAGLFVYVQLLEQSKSVLQAVFEELHQASRQAESNQTKLAEREYATDVQVAGDFVAKGDTAKAHQLLARHLPAAGPAMGRDLRGLEWHYLWELTTRDQPLARHTGGEPYQLQLSPDGKELAVAGKDGMLRLYEAGDLTLTGAMPTRQIEVNGVAYSASGRLAATAGDDGTVRVFDLALRQETLKIAAHPGKKAFGVVFYDEDRRLATCGTEPTIRLWNASTGEPDGLLEGHTKDVEALAVSPARDILASASADGTAMLWNLRKQAPVRTLSGHTGRLQSVAFSPDGRWLATGGLDNTVRLWDAARGKRAIHVETLYDEVQALAFSADSTRLLVGDRRGCMHRYRLHVVGNEWRPHLDADPVQDCWQAHQQRVWSIAAGPTAETIFTGGEDQLLRRWDGPAAARAEQSIGFPADDLPVDVAYSADGRWLFVLTEMSGVTMYDAATLAPRLKLGARHGGWRSLAIMEGRDEVAAGNAHGQIVIWNWRTGALAQVMDEAGQDSTISHLAYSPASRLLAALPYEADEVRLYAVETGKLRRRLPVHNHSVVALSPNGRRVAVDSDNKLLIFDEQSDKPLFALSGHAASVNSIAFHPSGKWLASGSDDRDVRFWSSDGGPLAPSGMAHYSDVHKVAFTPDGRSLLSIDERGIIRIAHANLRQPLIDIETHAEHLRGLAVSADSRRIAVIRTARGSTDVLIIGAGQATDPK